MPAAEPLCCGRWACSTRRRFWIFERGPSWKPRPRTRTATTRKKKKVAPLDLHGLDGWPAGGLARGGGAAQQPASCGQDPPG
jgi:hypothetical protein